MDDKLVQQQGIRRRPPWDFDVDVAKRLLQQQFVTYDLSGFGCEHLPLTIAAAGSLLQYAKQTQRSLLPHLTALQLETREHYVILDAATQRNLELIENLQGGREATLLSIYDRTATSMGGRLLRRWLLKPLRDKIALQQRQQAVSELATLHVELQKFTARYC